MLVIQTTWSLHFSNSVSLHKRWLDLETDTVLSLLGQNSFFSTLMTPSLSLKNRYSPHPFQATTCPDAVPLLWGQNFVINDNNDNNHCSLNTYNLSETELFVRFTNIIFTLQNHPTIVDI